MLPLLKILSKCIKLQENQQLVGLVRARTEHSRVSISEPEMKTVTRGKPYKLALLNHPKSCLKKVF